MIDQETRAAVLRAADFFDANPTSRTTSTLARNPAGEPVPPCDPDAVCWCGLGRIAFELGINPNGNYDELEERRIPITSVMNANDGYLSSNLLSDKFAQYLRNLIDA